MHTAESKCTLRRQNEQRKVRIKNFAGFWLLSKEQTGKTLQWVSTSIFKVYKGGSLSLKLLPRCESPRGVRIFKLYNRIFRQHRKYFSLFIRGPDGFESWKNIKVSNLVTNPYTLYRSRNKIGLIKGCQYQESPVHTVQLHPDDRVVAGILDCTLHLYLNNKNNNKQDLEVNRYMF